MGRVSLGAVPEHTSKPSHTTGTSKQNITMLTVDTVSVSTVSVDKYQVA